MSTKAKVSSYRHGCSRFPPDDPRRTSSEVKPYVLSPEELEEFNRKYPPVKRKMTNTEKSAWIINNMDKQRQKKVAEIKKEGKGLANNKEPKITREQLLEECKELGTSWDAARVIAEKYDLSKHTIKNYINKFGIKKELQPQPTEETKVQDQQSEPPKEVTYDNYMISQHGILDEFKLIRKGKFDKEKAVKIFYSVASLLDREEVGDFLIDLNISRG
jgi:hypothetical protein